MVKKQLSPAWRVTKRCSDANPYSELRGRTYCLNEERERWTDCAFEDYSRYKTMGEARKALNKKYMYELTNWGWRKHVKLWKYGVEEDFTASKPPRKGKN